MAQEQEQIRRHIVEAREAIGADLDALRALVDEQIATVRDWQKPLRDRPFLVVAGGFLGGMILGWIVG